jgi:hypothetical protein
MQRGKRMFKVGDRVLYDDIPEQAGTGVVIAVSEDHEWDITRYRIKWDDGIADCWMEADELKEESK